MTAERKQDVILVALVASVAVHVALMILIRPRVMTRVTLDAGRPRPTRFVTVRDAPAERDATLFATLPDVEAEKSEPVASADEFAPAAFAFDSAVPGGDEPAVAPPEPAAPATVEAPEVAPAAFLASKIHVTGVETGFVTPIAENAAPPVAAPSAPAAAAPAAAIPAVEAEVPVFTAAFAAPAVAEAAPEVPSVADAPTRDAFEPVAEVMKEVDERVVVAEKAAVRDLLDVRAARELAGCVSLAADSAASGQWTYFRVTVSPTAALGVVPKDVVILLDASGSIGNERLSSCRKAARKILRSCNNTGDRFNLVAFRDRFSYAFDAWRECDQASFDAADKWLSNLAAFGCTDVFATIRSVLTLPRDPKRPLVAMVVTDGDANSGVSETSQIISRFTALNDGLVSVYMYGVKERANRELLNILTHGNRGESFVFEGFRWSAGSGLEDLARKFRDPVLADMRLVLAAGSTAEVYPRLLKNLYRGGVVSFCGRVPAGTGEVSFSLRGLNGETAYEGFFTVRLSEARFDAKLPAEWNAERNVDLKLR